VRAPRLDILDKPLITLSNTAVSESEEKDAQWQKTRKNFLPIRTINALEAQGIYKVRDLLNKTEKELREIPNFGDKTMDLVFSVLEEFGFYRRSVRNNFKQDVRREC